MILNCGDQFVVPTGRVAEIIKLSERAVVLKYLGKKGRSADVAFTFDTFIRLHQEGHIRMAQTFDLKDAGHVVAATATGDAREHQQPQPVK